MATLLFLTAGSLGLLAFFEPCSIATNTLFSVRTHQLKTKSRYTSLLSVWISRSVLCAGLLYALVNTIEPPAWSGIAPSVILSVMALIYIVSRRITISVSHLEFYKLIPKGKSLPESIRLGLTLPACTIPLFVIVAGISVTHGSQNDALIAGFLFTTCFCYWAKHSHFIRRLVYGLV